MSSSITDKELKSKGVTAIEEALAKDSVAVITGGKNRFVVVPIQHYQYLRECELEAALVQTRGDLCEGRFVSSSAEEHLERIK